MVEYLDSCLTYSKGDNVLLTDCEGWTIAKLKLLSTPDIKGKLSIELKQESNAFGIDRSWVLISEASEFDAEIAFYYRNEIENAFSKENWFTFENDAVEDQLNLRAVKIEEDSLKVMRNNRVNPFSNKVVARSTICNENEYYCFRQM